MVARARMSEPRQPGQFLIVGQLAQSQGQLKPDARGGICGQRKQWLHQAVGKLGRDCRGPGSDNCRRRETARRGTRMGWRPIRPVPWDWDRRTLEKLFGQSNRVLANFRLRRLQRSQENVGRQRAQAIQGAERVQSAKRG